MIKISNLTKEFPDKPLFKELTLSLPEKGVVFLKGKSGVGKTTLLRMICGLDTDYSGEISGVDPESISVVFQEHRLFSHLSALANVTIVADEKDENANAKARALLSSLEISDEEMTLLPQELSGGMKQRVAIARAFINNSSLIILDEPFKELDRDRISCVTRLINERKDRCLIIIVSHDIPDGELAFDQVIEI